MNYRFKILLFCGVIAIAVSLILYSAFAHSGGTDSRGGHYNRKTGEYHYHGGGPARPATPPKKESPKIQETVESDITMLHRDIKLLRKEIALLRKEIKTLQLSQKPNAR